MKTCRVCNERLPQSAFYRDHSRFDGLKSSCKNCDGKYYQARRSLTKVELEIMDNDRLLRTWRVASKADEA